MRVRVGVEREEISDPPVYSFAPLNTHKDWDSAERQVGARD